MVGQNSEIWARLETFPFAGLAPDRRSALLAVESCRIGQPIQQTPGDLVKSCRDSPPPAPLGLGVTRASAKTAEWPYATHVPHLAKGT